MELRAWPLQVLHAAGLAPILLRTGTRAERAVQQPADAHPLHCHGGHDPLGGSSGGWAGSQGLELDSRQEAGTGTGFQRDNLILFKACHTALKGNPGLGSSSAYGSDAIAPAYSDHHERHCQEVETLVERPEWQP